MGEPGDGEGISNTQIRADALAYSFGRDLRYWLVRLNRHHRHRHRGLGPRPDRCGHGRFAIGFAVGARTKLGIGFDCGELESGGWVQLRTTPMSTFRIVIGKLMSVVWTLGLILLATLPGYAAMAYIHPPLSDQLIRVSISLLISAIMILSLSACVSAFQKQTATATAVSYGLLLALLAGTFLVWVARDQPFGREVVRNALLFNPAAAALAEMRVAGLESYNLLPMAWWIAGTITLIGFLLLGVQTWRLSRPS